MGLAAQGPGMGTAGLRRRLGSGCGLWRRCGGWFGGVAPGGKALCWVCGRGRLSVLGVGESRGGSCGGRRPRGFGRAFDWGEGGLVGCFVRVVSVRLGGFWEGMTGEG